MNYNVEMINDLIKNRRSVFISQFETEKQIPDEVIWQALDNANWAPNHKRTEPWRFTVFVGEGLQRLADFQSELYKTKSAENFKQVTYDKLKSNPVQCSHVIAVGMKVSERVPEVEEEEAIGCALQNIYLTLTAYGFGGYFSSGGITYYEEAKPFFGLEENDKLLGFFYAGVVAIPSAAGKRMPVQGKTTWISK